MRKVEHLLRDYKEGKITTQKGLVRLFSLLIQTGQINSLEGAYKNIAKELIHEGYLTEEGEIIDYRR